MSYTVVNHNKGTESALTLNYLLDALVKDQLVCAENATQLRTATHAAVAHPLTIIAKQRWRDMRGNNRYLTMDALLAWLGECYDQPVFTIDPLTINVLAITDTISYAFAKRHGILVVDISDDEVTIAHCDPTVRHWEQHVAHAFSRSVQRVLANPVDLGHFTQTFYSLAQSVRGATAQHSAPTKHEMTHVGQLLELGTHKALEANDQPIVDIVDWLLRYALEQRASDIHIEPRRSLTLIRLRIDGILHTVYELPVRVGAAVTSRLKILSHLDVAEKRRPQDGRLTAKPSVDQEVELRLATLPTTFGEKMVLRIFDHSVSLRSFDPLGLSPADHEKWQTMTTRKHGLVLVTGPTGSGKTTTLYTTLKQLATPQVNVCTIEDPIEMIEDCFNQMQVQHSIGLDFASGIRALLRQDPDIMMVGEIRDLETANMAIQAALTGHLVLSTLHTSDAPSAIMRLLELGIPAYLLKATLVGVMAQRLLRTLCMQCKQPGKMDQQIWHQLTKPSQLPLPSMVYHPIGCPACRHTGYHGRRSIVELLPLSNTLQKQLNQSITLSQLRDQASSEGMQSLRLCGAHAVAAGVTTIDEVLRVALD